MAETNHYTKHLLNIQIKNNVYNEARDNKVFYAYKILVKFKKKKILRSYCYLDFYCVIEKSKLFIDLD